MTKEKTKKELELEKKKKLPVKQYYEVRVEAMLPAVITYRVLAETAEEAAGLIKHMSPVGVKHKLIGRKEIQLKVYDSGGSVIKFMRKLFGG